jgi:hypothetical protein
METASRRLRPELLPLELGLFAAILWADEAGFVPLSKTPFLFLVAWGSLWLRGLRWPDVGLTVGVAFGLAHLYQGPSGVIQATVGGVLLGVLYLATGRHLVAPIIAHGVGNSIDFTVMYRVTTRELAASQASRPGGIPASERIKFRRERAAVPPGRLAMRPGNSRYRGSCPSHRRRQARATRSHRR